MDAQQIHNLFDDQKMYKKYIKKDLIRVYNETDGGTIRFTCHTLTNKLIDYADGFLIFKGTIDSAAAIAGGAGVDTDMVGLNNNGIFKNCKCSFNNNEVEHNRRPDISTVWLNLLEYSPDYASSIAVQWGFAKDQGPGIGGVNNASTTAAGYELRNIVTRSNLAGGDFPVTAVIPLKHLFQFFRRLNFPIINQLLNLELELNDHISSLLRHANTPACTLIMNSLTLYVPEVTLPTEINNKFMNMLSSGKMIKTLHWDMADFISQRNLVAANVQFDKHIGANLQGVRKILCMVITNPVAQTDIETVSNIAITNLNFEIDSKDLYHMNVQSDQEAYRLVSECFNSQGKDVNTGSILPYTDWVSTYRLYAFDLSRQEVFESDPKVIQTIRFRGTPSNAGNLRIIVMKNKITEIDMSNPSNTRTI